MLQPFISVLQNAEFHSTISELLAWIEATTQTVRDSEPIDLAQPRQVKLAKGV
jgi:hypothetical protein